MFNLNNVGALVRQGSDRLVPGGLADLRSIDTGMSISGPWLSHVEAGGAVALGSIGFWLVLVAPIAWPAAATVDWWLARSAALALIAGLLASVVAKDASMKARRGLAMVATASCVAIFALPLSLDWGHDTTSGSIIGGLIPYSDAAGYMAGAWHLLAEESLNHWNMRRPLNAALHALRWVLAGGDMATSLALVAWLTGLGSTLAAAFLRRDIGWAAAVLFVLAWLSYVAEWLPLTLSESHGSLLGVIGFALIWRSAGDRSPLTFGLGMAVLSLALAARAGPFLMLPTLLVWGVLYLGRSPRGRVSLAAIGFLGLALGQSVSRFFNALWSDSTNAVYSNFSYTLYGMTAGGKQWNAVYADLPEIFQTTAGESSELAAKIYQAALDNFLAEPGLLLGFLGRELARFPSFLVTSPMIPADSRDFWIGLLIVGGLWMLATWRRPVSGLLMAGLVGIWLSSPFLMLDGGHRVFAPGVPWIAAALAFGAYAAISLTTVLSRAVKASAGLAGSKNEPGRIKVSVDRRDSWLGRHGPAMVGGGTLLAVFAGPVLAVAAYPRIEVEPTGVCPAGQIERAIRPAWSSIILQAIPETATDANDASAARHPAYFRDLPLELIPFMTTVARQTAPYALMQVYDLVSPEAGRQTSVHAIRRHDVEPLPKDGLVTLCGVELCAGCYLFDIRSWRRTADD